MTHDRQDQWADRFERLRQAVHSHGPRGDLVYLNSLTDHRFSALYLFEGETSKSSCFFDREQPELTNAAAVPVSGTFCMFVRDQGVPLAIDDTRLDGAALTERLAPGEARLHVRSYCGLPLRRGRGEVVGSICHFDVVPRPRVSVRHFDLMQRFADML